jgi:hypothetical protein
VLKKQKPPVAVALKRLRLLKVVILQPRALLLNKGFKMALYEKGTGFNPVPFLFSTGVDNFMGQFDLSKQLITFLCITP